MKFEIFEKVSRLQKISILLRKSYYNLAQVATFSGGEPLFQNSRTSRNANFLNFYFFLEIFSGDILITSSFHENEVLVGKNEDKNVKIEKCPFFSTNRSSAIPTLRNLS